MALARRCLRCQRRTRNGSYCERWGTTTARGYGAAHQRRARQVIAAQPWCAVCGHPGSPGNPLTADHVVPVSRGGASGPLRVACRRCNSRRGSAAAKQS